LLSLLFVAAVAAVAAVAGCRSGTSVDPTQQLALLSTREGDPFSLLDLKSGRVVGQPSSGLGAFGQDARAVSADTSMLVSSGGGKLVGFDLRAERILWTESLGAPGQQRFSGQLIYASIAMALTVDGTQLLAADSHANGTTGVAVLNGTTRDAVGFIDGLRAAKLLTFSVDSLASTSRILALGTRRASTNGLETDRWQGQLFLIGGNPIAIQDSLKFLSAADSIAGGVAEMTLDRAGRYLYYVTYGRKLHKYNLAQRSDVAVLTVPSFGGLALSRDESSIYMIDGSHTQDDPGLGAFYIIDSDLHGIQRLDLAAARRDGLPPILNCVTVSKDGESIYLGAGTASRGPTYGVQHGSVIVINATTRTVDRVLPLDGWGVLSILLL
jgi:hypothetical protein